MKRRLIALLLVLATVLSMFPATALAASSEEEALGEVNIYHSGEKVSYLSINGRVREQTYTYYNYVDDSGSTKQIPAYCVNPNTAGVPQTVPAGSSIKYLANEKSSDPKVFGIVASGYPHRSLEDLGLNSVNEGYYATKMALWCYLLDNWSINDLTVNPSADQAAAQRVLAAAKDIYQTGMYWDSIKAPASLPPLTRTSPTPPPWTVRSISSRSTPWRARPGWTAALSTSPLPTPVLFPQEPASWVRAATISQVFLQHHPRATALQESSPSSSPRMP